MNTKVNNQLSSKSRRLLHRQRGNALIAVIIAIVISILLAVIGIPGIKGIIIEGRVPEVAAEVQRTMARLRVMGETGVALPFTNVSNANNLVPMLEGSSVMLANAETSTVAHRLGGRGTGTNGTITLAPAAFDAYGVGSAYSLTLTNVHRRACPTLTTILAGISENITINGNVVKANTEAAADVSYNAVDAERHCVAGDNNTFVLISR